MDELIAIQQQYNLYPNVITFPKNNIIVSSPYAITDLCFYQTRETLMDVDVFRSFLRNAETRFRSSNEYKAYKSYLIEYMGINQCQIFGNITNDDAEIELHHNVIGLFDICLMIATHMINTVGIISTFDLIQMLIFEHWNNNVGVTFLSSTAHQIYTNDPDGYIPPEQTIGRWWELLYKYKYGITFDIAYKVINYIKKYQDKMPVSIDIRHQEEILNFASFNEYGMPPEQCGFIAENHGDMNYENYVA